MPEPVADGQPYESPPEAAAQIYASASPSFGTELDATAQGGLNWLSHAVARGTFAGASDLDRSLYQMGTLQSRENLPWTDENARETVGKLQPIVTPTIPADEVNRRFAPPGVKITNEPMPEGLARLVGQQKQEEIDRNDVLARYANTHSWLTNFGVGMAGFMLDPINASTLFIPGIGEDMALAGFARAGLGTGFVARTAARTFAGGLTGALAQAPLSFLHYTLGKEEASDYDLRSAFQDMFYNAAGAAIIHAGFGAGRDLLKARYGERAATTEPGVKPGPEEPAFSPKDTELEDQYLYNIGRGADLHVKFDAMRSAIAQMMDGRPLDVMPVFDEAEMRRSSNVARLNAQIADRQAQLAQMPVGDPVARATLTRLESVESRLRDETIMPEERRTLMQRRDELLADTTPEKLQQAAAPFEQRRGLDSEVEALARERDRIKAESTAARTEQAMRQPIVDPSSVAETQRLLYERGYHVGWSDPDFARMQETFAEKPAREAKPAEAAPKPPEAAKPAAAAPAAKLGEELPPVKPGFTRVYHGGDNPASGGSRWVSRSLEYAANYRPGQSVHYVDIPNDHPLFTEKPHLQGEPEQGIVPVSSFEVPEDLAAKMKPVDVSKPAEGEKPAEAPTPSAGTVPGETASELARVEALHAQMMKDAALLPEDRADLDRTQKGLDAAELTGQLYADAAQCLTEAGV